MSFLISRRLIPIISSLTYDIWQRNFIEVIQFDTEVLGTIEFIFYDSFTNVKEIRNPFCWWKLNAFLISLRFLSFLTTKKGFYNVSITIKKKVETFYYLAIVEKGFIRENNRTVVYKHNFGESLKEKFRQVF